MGDMFPVLGKMGGQSDMKGGWISGVEVICSGDSYRERILFRPCLLSMSGFGFIPVKAVNLLEL